MDAVITTQPGGTSGTVRKASIASQYAHCKNCFSKLLTNIETSNHQAFGQRLQNEFGRFRVWAGNVGAHRAGRVSLDHRLREASHIYEELTKLLGELNKNLEEALKHIEIEVGKDGPSPISESLVSLGKDFMAEQSPLRGEEVKLTDFEYLVLDITHIITCLYRFSIAIQNPAPKERLHKIALIDVSHFKDWDVQHIIEMFHPADPHNNFRVDGFLSERLGKANTRRRQLLGYYKSHHEKISKHIDDPPSSASVIEGTELPTVMVPTGEGAPAPQMLPNPERAATVCTMAMSQTTVPTIKPEPKKGDEAEWKLPQTPYAKLRQAVEVEQNDDQLSQTSYATTINHKMRIRVPSPPDEIAAFDGEPFECPYCFTITEIRDRQDWKKHVFTDLQPYVCTFRDCPNADQLYSSQHEWYDHEVQLHRREWYCDDCSTPFPQKTLFQEHIKAKHSELVTKEYSEEHIEAVISRCERAIVTNIVCPLCGIELTFKTLEKHLGLHLQEVALFVLPRPEPGEGDQSSESNESGKSKSMKVGYSSECSSEYLSTKSSLDFGLDGQQGDRLIISPPAIDGVRCICSYQHDDGFLITCDKCKELQHGVCMGIDKNDFPEVYECATCIPEAHHLEIEVAISIQESFIKSYQSHLPTTQTPSQSTSSQAPTEPMHAAGVHPPGIQSPTLQVLPMEHKTFQNLIHNTLSDDDKAAFLSAPNIMERLQEMQGSVSSALTARVEKVLQCVKNFMNSLARCIPLGPEILSLAVGGVNCILTLVLGYIEFFERFTGMMERIGDHLSLISNYITPDFQQSEKLQSTVAAVYCELLEFYVKARQVFINKKGKPLYIQGFKLFFKLTWEPFEAQFGSIEARFSNHAIAVVRLANMDHQTRALEYQNRENELHRLEEDKGKKEEAYKMRRKILKWLSQDDFEETHQRHFRKRFENTGQWLLDDHRFKSWRDGAQSSLLWCHGSPGTGKTILASLVIEHLSALYELSAGAGITFIYCNYKEYRTPMTYMRLALTQLCRKMQSLPSALQEVYERHYRNNSQPKNDELRVLFLATIKQFRVIFFVVDALDECPLDARKDLCDFFLGIASTTTGQGVVKLFIMSRKEPDIDRAFQQESIPMIEIQAAKVDSDIEVYVKAQIELRLQNGSLVLRNIALKNKILFALTAKANGMFLWVELQLGAICAEISDDGIERALARVPDDLDATYERILNIINQKPRVQRELARRTLIWTAYSRRPLLIDELAYLVSIDKNTATLEDLASVIPTEETILNACANLISVNQYRFVRFVHFSVQGFLTSHRSTTLSMGYEVAHREIAQMCMTILTLQGDSLASYQYAFDEWPHHLLAGNLNTVPKDDRIMAAASSFFERYPKLFTEQPEYFWGVEKKKIYLTFSPEVLALIFNLPDTQKRLPSDKKQSQEGQTKPVDNPGLGCIVLSDDNLAIHYATAELDSVSVVQRLYTNGYPLNYVYSAPNQGVPGWLRLSPLYSVQSTQMARYLLDKGADANDQGGQYGSALQAAVFKGNFAVSRLLLDRGANVNAQCGQFGNALQTAVYRGKLEVIQLLLDMGADVNAQGGMFGTVLQAAAYNGNLEVIDLLLERGADINARGGRYGAALEEVLALESGGSGLKVPGDISLLMQLLNIAPTLTSEWEYENIARGFLNDNRCSLDTFKELLKSKGGGGTVRERNAIEDEIY